MSIPGCGTGNQSAVLTQPFLICNLVINSRNFNLLEVEESSSESGLNAASSRRHPEDLDSQITTGIVELGDTDRTIANQRLPERTIKTKSPISNFTKGFIYVYSGVWTKSNGEPMDWLMRSTDDIEQVTVSRYKQAAQSRRFWNSLQKTYVQQ
ncbi:jg23990 [Pararge aegeria aegeria]|uniref:Jg23990 protein n=1 Tax=Pararge aegeria aegeria TaxID=348720 RepID=A0A8S4QMN3_9NEOP|nr:jg23990 [Pararge aegeria aegeria]